jgi:hypothetical protein
MKTIFTFIMIIVMCTASYADEIIKEFSGKGHHITRPFSVPNGWEIQWEAMGRLLQVYVNKTNGELDGIAANQQGPGIGSSYQPKGGSYYLEMNAFGEWKVTVVKVQ